MTTNWQMVIAVIRDLSRTNNPTIRAAMDALYPLAIEAKQRDEGLVTDPADPATERIRELQAMIDAIRDVLRRDYQRVAMLKAAITQIVGESEKAEIENA